ncbi:MAG: hypothetical protein RIQ93_1999 [Verrucomicrobiota bacterium]|jgi:hypothetical protein
MGLVKALLTGLVVVGALVVGVFVATLMAVTRMSRSFGRHFGKAPLPPRPPPHRAAPKGTIGDDGVIDVTVREVPEDSAKS